MRSDSRSWTAARSTNQLVSGSAVPWILRQHIKLYLIFTKMLPYQQPLTSPVYQQARENYSLPYLRLFNGIYTKYLFGKYSGNARRS